jgi:hypothetical protein
MKVRSMAHHGALRPSTSACATPCSGAQHALHEQRTAGLQLLHRLGAGGEALAGTPDDVARVIEKAGVERRARQASTGDA